MKRRRVEGEGEIAATSRGKGFIIDFSTENANENGFQIYWTRETEIQFLEEIVSARGCNDIGPYRGAEEWAKAWPLVLRRLELKNPDFFALLKAWAS
ncbi:hypothetical protein M5689_000824 [Euphorbia peplus]|nr:hypothetical protein M5689_000824 [Euphorbia peplus]